MSFFSRLVNPNDGTVSSKTVVGLLAFVLVAAYAIKDIIFGAVVNDTIFFGVIGIIGACFGLNTLISNKKLDTIKQPDVNVEKADNVVVAKPAQNAVVAPPPAQEYDVSLEENEILG